MSDCSLPPLCNPTTFVPRCEEYWNTLVCAMTTGRGTAGLRCLECDAVRGRCGSCGDSVLDTGEECDYPDRTDGDGCDSNCTCPVR